MSTDMRDYLDGNVPLTPAQKQARAETYAHAGMCDPEPQDRRVFYVDVPEKVDAEKFMEKVKKEFAKKEDHKQWRPMAEPVTGLLAFYMNVGQLSPDAAEDFVEKYKSRLNEKSKFLDRLKAQGVEVLFLPVRDQETSVEFIKL
jgi:hypothetical protein